MSEYCEIKFTDADVANIEEWIPFGNYNPHNVRPWLLHDHGFVVAVVFATCESEALDAAADCDKLGRYLIDQGEFETEYKDDSDVAYLGNAAEPFDVETLSVVELPNPRMSFCQLFSNQQNLEKVVEK